MILLVNTFITNSRMMQYNRYNLPITGRFEILKYTLASYSVIPFDYCIFNIKLDHDFQHRKQELEEWISKHFSNYELNFTRCEYQNQWVELIERLPNKPIFLACNEDHVFLDSELKTILRGRSIIEKFQEPCGMYYSHWPEILRVSQSPTHSTDLDESLIEEGFISFKWSFMDSIQIVNKQLLKMWFCKHNYGQTYIPRPDWGPSIHILKTDPYKVYVPLKELCRHYDGYGHVGLDPNACPPLEIPPGFFEDNIPIVLTQQHQEGLVSMHPLASGYKAAVHGGVDLRCHTVDLPLFWQSRIKDGIIITGSDWEIEKGEDLYEGRNKAYRQKALANHHSPWTDGPPPKEEWLKYQEI